MKANVINKRGVSLITFEGQLNFSLADRLRDKLKELYKSKRNSKVIFDLSGIEFVGSTGIKDFILMLGEFNKRGMKPRFIGLTPEFQRLFKAFQGKKTFTVFKDEKEALLSYRKRMWPKKGNV